MGQKKQAGKARWGRLAWIFWGEAVKAALRSLISDVDVGGDVFDDLRLFRVHLDEVLNAFDGVEDGGVVPVVEFLADLLQGEVGHPADLVHGDLPGQGGVLGAALPPEGVGVDVVELAHLVDDDVRRGQEVGLVLEHVPHRPGYGVHVHALPHQLLEGKDFVDRALDLPHVGGDVLRDILEHRVGQIHAAPDGLVFDDGHPGLVVGRLDVHGQAPLEPGAQPVVQPQHLLGRPVGGEHDLSACFVQGVEGVEHLLLGGLAAGDELHVVHEEYVRRAVLLPKFGVAPLTDGLDELVGEGVALNIDDPVVRVVLVDLVGDGVQQVGLAQAGLAVDEQGVVGLGGPLGHRLGRRVGEFVGRAHHEPLKGVLLGARQKDIVGFFLAEVLQLALSQDYHLEVGGEELVERLLDHGQIAGHDDVPLEVGGGVEHKPVGVQRHGGGVVKPGVDRGGGHIPLHEGEHLGPDIGREIHGKTTSFGKYQ